jgi:Fe2+ transport system protein FeoA
MNYIHCPLCGFEFEKADTPCERGCPLGKFCKLVCCPNCRYEFPGQSHPLGWVQLLLHRPRPAAPPSGLPGLNDLQEGESGEVVCLNCPQNSRRNALAVFGLVPGASIVLQQKRPAFVIRIGETELALEADIAREILVKPLPPKSAAD